MARLLLIVVLLFGAAQAQDTPAKINSTEVAPGIYVLEGDDIFVGGSISMLVGDDYNILIDDGMPPFAPAVLAAVADLAGGPIDFLINTHVHGDHVGANAAFADTGAVVYAHDNLRTRLLEKPADAGGVGGLPVVTFSDELTFHVNGQEAYVFHVEHAHTDGDAAIEFRGSNVIHAGDIFFSYVFPYIDLDNGGSVRGYLAAQRRILAMSDDDTVIIAGHGKLVSDKADLQAAIDMLVDAESRVEALILEGMSEEEVVAANPLAEYHDTWNWMFITTEIMTKTLYRSLTSE